MEFNTLLDTTVGETGPEQSIPDKFLVLDTPLRFQASIASGDTIVINGRNGGSDDLEILHTFVDDVPIDLYVSPFIEVARTVDGAVGDSTVTVSNPWNADLPLTDHE